VVGQHAGVVAGGRVGDGEVSGRRRARAEEGHAPSGGIDRDRAGGGIVAAGDPFGPAAAGERHPVHVGAAALARAEQEVIAGDAGDRPRVGGGAEHHVAVEAGRELRGVGRAIGVDGEQAGMPRGRRRLAGEEDPVGRDPDDARGAAGLGGDARGFGAVGGDVEDVDGAAGAEVAVVVRRRHVRDPRAVRRPRRTTGGAVALGELTGGAGLVEVDEEQVAAAGSDEAGAIRLVPEAVGLDGRVR
jgi:hypothetical protein